MVQTFKNVIQPSPGATASATALLVGIMDTPSVTHEAMTFQSNAQNTYDNMSGWPPKVAQTASPQKGGGKGRYHTNLSYNNPANLQLWQLQGQSRPACWHCHSYDH